jgi:predicted aminopeptidase
MIHQGPEALGDLAEVILHESLHATFYVAGQSTLNESVAEFVGSSLAQTYMAGAEGVTLLEQLRYADSQIEDQARGQAMKRAYEQLNALYACQKTKTEMQSEKTRILTELRMHAQMRRYPNNATLIQYKTYGSGQHEMEQLLAHCKGSFPRFIRTLESVRAKLEAAKSHEEPQVLLRDVANTCVP